MQDGINTVSNHGLPIRLENKDVIIESCKIYGYIPTFGAIHYEEVIEFIGIKMHSNEN